MTSSRIVLEVPHITPRAGFFEARFEARFRADFPKVAPIPHLYSYVLFDGRMQENYFEFSSVGKHVSDQCDSMISHSLKKALRVFGFGEFREEYQGYKYEDFLLFTFL